MTPLHARHPADADGVVASAEEGRAFREGVYRPLPEAELPEVPDTAAFPARGHGPAYRLWNEVPRVPRVRYLVGPSVIAAGMGLGAGEFLLWPNLITVNGYSIWWLFVVGLLTQFVVIHEIERWTIATGESIFAGMARLDRWAFWPWFFLVATLLSTFWPGWASQSADLTGRIVAEVVGVALPWQPIALVMLAVIWVALAASRIVYNALERFEILLVASFFPLLLLALTAVGVRPSDVAALARGAVSVGRAPEALLTGAQFPTLLIAVAYAGSGGGLLLIQSLWVRDKGFGMGAFMGRVAGIRGRNEEVSRTGYAFDPAAPGALARFRAWMAVSQRELLVTFLLLIVLSVMVTTLLVTATLGTGNAELAGDLTRMVALQGEALQVAGGRWLRIGFLLGGALVLFSTQVAIVDSLTRLSGTIFYERYGRNTRFWTPKRTFLVFLTGLVVACMALIAVSWTGGAAMESIQPNFLVLIAGPLTIACMYALALVVGYVNTRRLPRALAPPLWKRLGMLWAATLWGWFTAEQLSRTLLQALAAPREAIEGIVWHPVRIALYAVLALSLVWFARTVVGASPHRGAPRPEPAGAPSA